MEMLAILVAVICQVGLPPAAQDQRSVKEPEEINQFFFLDSTGEIRPLEEQTMNGRTIQGDGSDFRFVQGEPLAFIVKVASQDVDPKTIINFLRLTVKGEDRVITEASKRSKNGAGLGGAVPFEATPYGESSFKIKPKVDLGPGEYALRPIHEKHAYCFAVDPVKTDLK